MFVAGKVLFLAFFDICRLIKKPQDIPASKNLLTICLAVYGFLSIQLAVLSQPIDKAIFAGVLEVALIMIFSLALLQIRGKSERWVQMVSALAGTGIIISIIAIPLYIFIGIGGDDTATSGGIHAFGLLLLAVLACWNITIMGHILRHALDINMFSAIILAISYIWIIFSFTAAIMPMDVT
jgi:hypothetical protein